jgi:hypothetical protein
MRLLPDLQGVAQGVLQRYEDFSTGMKIEILLAENWSALEDDFRTFLLDTGAFEPALSVA